MAQCNGCSRFFRLLEDPKCDACKEKSEVSSKPRSEWTTCYSCGKGFEFLNGNECLPCQDHSKQMPPPPIPNLAASPKIPLASLSQNSDRFRDIDYAMTKAVDPRTHGTSNAVPYQNPLQSHEPFRGGKISNVSKLFM